MQDIQLTERMNWKPIDTEVPQPGRNLIAMNTYSDYVVQLNLAPVDIPDIHKLFDIWGVTHWVYTADIKPTRGI